MASGQVLASIDFIARGQNAQLSDFWPHGDVAEKYGILNEDGHNERVIFIIDKNGVIRYADHHDMDDVPDNEELFKVLEGFRQSDA